MIRLLKKNIINLKNKKMDNSVFILLPSGFLFIICMVISAFAKGQKSSKTFLLSGMACGFIAAASIVSLMFKDMEIGARVRFSVVTTLLIMMVLVAIIKFWFGRKIAR